MGLSLTCWLRALRTKRHGHFCFSVYKGRPLELIDECLGKSCPLSEVLRCVHLSLLCMQLHPEHRQSMSSVVVVLGSESALPQPKKPLEKKSNEAHGFSSKQESPSINEITNTLLEAHEDFGANAIDTILLI